MPHQFCINSLTVGSSLYTQQLLTKNQGLNFLHFDLSVSPKILSMVNNTTNITVKKDN